MGISRDSQHKRRLTGGKKPKHHMKRKFEMGRQMAMTKIGAKRTREVRCRGGNMKYRALRLDTGNFSWGSEVCTRKTRVLDVVYNASNNELVRTKTLVKGAIVQIDATYAAARVASAQQKRQGRGRQASERLEVASGCGQVVRQARSAQGHHPQCCRSLAATSACGRGRPLRAWGGGVAELPEAVWVSLRPA